MALTTLFPEENGVGEAMKGLREKLGFSIYRMAEEIGINHDYAISLYEQGKRRPKVETLYKYGFIARQYKIKWSIDLGA